MYVFSADYLAFVKSAIYPRFLSFERSTKAAIEAGKTENLPASKAGMFGTIYRTVGFPFLLSRI